MSNSGCNIFMLSVMKKKNSKPVSATARPIKYVPVDDLIDLRNQMQIERIFPTDPTTKKIVPTTTLVIKCIFLAVSMSNASSVSGVVLTSSGTRLADIMTAVGVVVFILK